MTGTLAIRQREFITALIARERDRALPPAQQRHFLDRLLDLAAKLSPPTEPKPVPQVDPLAAFRERVMTGWDGLRWRVHAALSARRAALDQRGLRALRRLEEAPALLEPLGLARSEVHHTQVIGWLLERRDDVGRRALWRLLRELNLPGVRQARVGLEEHIGPRCKIDLSIETATHLIFIENKVDARERPAQLDDYDAALGPIANSRGRTPVLVFLTLDARDDAKSAAVRLHITYYDLARIWLPVTLEHGPTADYLTSWLKTVLGDLLKLSEPGPVSSWSLQYQHAMYNFLDQVEWADA